VETVYIWRSDMVERRLLELDRSLTVLKPLQMDANSEEPLPNSTPVGIDVSPFVAGFIWCRKDEYSRPVSNRNANF